MDTITFNNKSYPVVELPSGFKVSVESLEHELLDKNGCPIDNHAAYIDTEIYFYVPDDMIYKPIDELADFVDKNVY